MIKLRSTPFSNMFRTLIHGESIQDSQIYTVTELLHMALGQSYITKGLSRSKWAGRLVSNLHRLISSPVSKTPVMEGELRLPYFLSLDPDAFSIGMWTNLNGHNVFEANRSPCQPSHTPH
jgi:hypothetical protein